MDKTRKDYQGNKLRKTNNGKAFGMERIVATLPTSSESGLNSQTTLNISPDSVSTEIVNEPSRLYHITKHIIDVVLATIGIIVLLPVFLVIAICIKFDD